MSIFSRIKDAIFGHKAAEPGTRPQSPTGTTGTSPSPAPAEASNVGIAPPATEAEAQVDVEQVLTQMAVAKGNPDLNWQTSIVDLLKLIGVDSSLDHRKELATELGYTGALDGSAEMNIWLHRAVMRELAKNGGNVPSSMTD